MDRRDFIKSSLFAATLGAISGPKAIAHEDEKRAIREQFTKDILNQRCSIGRWEIQALKFLRLDSACCVCQ